MLNRFEHKLKELGVKKNEPIAIAVSGGCDSMALCYLCQNAGVDATAIIVDHRYRRNSEKEAKAVQDYLTKELGLEAVILTNKKKIPKTGVEEFMRELRYELIFEQLKRKKIKKILMAHHLDDQVETFLMRLERGAGLDGLTGIKEVSKMKDISVIRPLLGFTKDELKALLKKNKIKWWEDPTNENVELTRNNIRKTLSGFSDYEQMRKRITTVIGNIDRARDFIESEKEKAAADMIKKVKGSLTAFDLNKYKKLHSEIRLRLLRETIKKYSKTGKDVRMDSIRTLDDGLMKKEFKVAELHGLRITKDKANLVIFR